MKRWLFLLLLLATDCAVNAQLYTIGWGQAAGGSATAGGAYLLTGSAVSLASAPSAGGFFSEQVGSLAILMEAETSGELVLKIQLRSDNHIILSWRNASELFVLQQNSGFDPAAWAPVEAPLTVAGNELQAILSLPLENRFYRLARP